MISKFESYKLSGTSLNCNNCWVLKPIESFKVHLDMNGSLIINI
jgi:hypothetical protein